MRDTIKAGLAAAATWLALAPAAWAQGPALPDVVSLSPVEREAALNRDAAQAGRDLPINGLSRGVHGEIGTSLDSRGGHAVFGGAQLPLGQSGAASFSFLQADSGHRPH